MDDEAFMKRWALGTLDRYKSWKLERISNTTYPKDVTIKLSDLTLDEAAAIHTMIRGGSCYRCRISKGRWFFGSTAAEAAEKAAADYDKRIDKKRRKK